MNACAGHFRLPHTLKMEGRAARYTSPPTIIGVRPESPNSADGPFQWVVDMARPRKRQKFFTPLPLHAAICSP